MRRLAVLFACTVAHHASAAPTQRPAETLALSQQVQAFVAVDARVVAVTHVRIIDGTGAPPLSDQTIVIADGSIRQIGPTATLGVPDGARVIDGSGRTALPGLVGMHDHLFYAQFGSELLHDAPITAPRLYLAAGVTTIRTAGSINPYLDLGVKKRVDGRMAGPKIHVSGPYLQGKGAFTPQMPELQTADEVVRTVAYWASEGVTSFKVYAQLPRALVKAAIDAAHERGLKVTAHLCALTFAEAIALGIDNIEHGLPASSDFDTDKKPDACPDFPHHLATIAALDVRSPRVQKLIHDLVTHNVALTSTLAVYEASVPGRAALLRGRVAEALSPDALVDAGFTPLEAIHIATQNGANFLGEGARIGTITMGKRADIVLVRGNPAEHIRDLENVDLVFKDGVGFDPDKLVRSVRGQVGLR